MPSAKVSDLDLVRACLELYDADVAATARNVALHLGMAPSGMYRRLDGLCEKGYLRRYNQRNGNRYHPRPKALDLAGQFREGTVQIYWQLSQDSPLYLMPIIDD